MEKLCTQMLARKPCAISLVCCESTSGRKWEAPGQCSRFVQFLPGQGSCHDVYVIVCFYFYNMPEVRSNPGFKSFSEVLDHGLAANEELCLLPYDLGLCSWAKLIRTRIQKLQSLSSGSRMYRLTVRICSFYQKYMVCTVHIIMTFLLEY